jgi:uncharacterized membrane protein YwaF
MKKVILIILITIFVLVIFVAYELVRFNEVLLPGFSYYSRCLDNSCTFTKQPKNLRTLYDTYCCDKEIILSCNNESGKTGKRCVFVCIGEYYKKGGVQPSEGYCN